MNDSTPPDETATGAPAPSRPVLPGYHQARDGLLTRIPVPGGLLTSAQARVLAEVAEAHAGGALTITSRANVQLRGLHAPLPVEVLARLQRAGLASLEPVVNHLRNFMASPAAGLDPDAIVDTAPLVRALDAYVQSHVELGVLPMKFGIGLDAGERASIAGQPNDVLFRAYRDEAGAPRFRALVRMGADEDARADLGVALTPEQVVPFAAAIAAEYLDAMPGDGSRPHLHHLLVDVEVDAFRARLTSRVPSVAETPAPAFAARAPHPPVGVHAQATPADEEGTVYVGLAPLLGALTSTQLRSVAELADRYASGALRLSPWCNVLLPDVRVRDVDALQAALDGLGLPSRPEAVVAGLVACAGSVGCTAGLADTVRDARALSARLVGAPALDVAGLDIHFAGCAKCCAHRQPAGITLVGCAGDVEAYDVFVAGEGDPRLGRLVRRGVSAGAIVDAVERMVLDRAGSPRG